MIRKAAAALLCTLIAGAAAHAAEVFYLDRDPFTNEYVGPVGPLVLSGEIVPGDYARLLAKIAEDENRFLERNKLILASNDGNAAEAVKIAKLVKALYTEVIVAPLTGRCAGACFLIFVAAAQRGTDGENLLGIHRPGLAESQWISMSTTDAALLEDAVQAPVRAFLVENEVPGGIIEEMFNHLPTDVRWLTEADERSLGSRSPSFQKYLVKNCAWDDGLERAIYKGEKSPDALKEQTACRIKMTRPEAHKALAAALKDAQSNTTRGK